MKVFQTFASFLRANNSIRLAHFAIAPLGIAGFFLKGGALSGYDGFLILLAFFIIDNLGLNTGFHKLLSHRAFKTSGAITALLSFLGVFAGQGSPLVWAAIHRSLHHPFADTDKDPHSPREGFFHSFIAWYWRTGKVQFHSVKDLLKMPAVRFIHRWHILILYSGFLTVLLAFGFKALITLMFIPLCLSLLLSGLVNAILHSPQEANRFLDRLLICYKNHNDLSDNSKNSALLGFLTAGLGYHNNHHRFPEKFNLSEKWWEWDLSVPFILIIKTRS